MDEISTEQLQAWIRTREAMVLRAAEGSRERRESQKMLDYLTSELGRRGED